MIRRLACWLGIHLTGQAASESRWLRCPHCGKTWSEA
jgi:transposase-like protein